MAVTSENNSKFAKFKNGTGVTIERSNGRQHSATIIEIDRNKGTIQVEWEEGSDVKAKTLSVDTVLRLNPNLVADKLDETKTITPVPEKPIPEQKPPVKSKLAPTVQKDKMSRPNSVQNGMRKSFPDKRPKTPNNLAKIKIAPKASEVPVIKNRPSSVQEKKITKPSVNRKSI